MGFDSDWREIAVELVTRNICELTDFDVFAEVRGQKVLGSLMGVAKAGNDRVSGPQRLIMKIKVSSCAQVTIAGDIPQLHTSGQWRRLVLEDGETLVWSGEGLKCCFYVFEIPKLWRRWMAFSALLQSSAHGLGISHRSDSTRSSPSLIRSLVQSTVDHQLQVETESPEWLPPLTEGLTRSVSSSTDISPADVEIPPPAFLLFLHLRAKPTSNKACDKHNLFTHVPKGPNCEVCNRTKVTRAPCRSNSDDRADRLQIAERLGDLITAAHKVHKEEQEPRIHHPYAVAVHDLATQWIQSFPCQTKSALETQKSLRQFLHPEGNPRSLNTDNSVQLATELQSELYDE